MTTKMVRLAMTSPESSHQQNSSSSGGNSTNNNNHQSGEIIQQQQSVAIHQSPQQQPPQQGTIAHPAHHMHHAGATMPQQQPPPPVEGNGHGLFIGQYTAAGDFYPEHGYFIPHHHHHHEMCPAAHAPLCTLHDFGPVTVPMVSQSGSPPIPMPVQVPPGHLMQQIVDENGTLRHVILSTAHNQQIHGQGSVQGVQHHIHGHYIAANGTTPSFYGPLATGYPGPGPGPHFHPIPGGHLQPQQLSHSPHSPSPPNNNYHKDERTQRQHTKLLRKLDQQQQKQREMNSALSTPAHSPSPRKSELNGLRRTTPASRNGASSVGTSEDGEESSSVPDEEDDYQPLIDQLSAVQSPQVSEVMSKSALLQWAAPPNSEQVTLNPRDLQYEVLLSDRGKDGKYKSIFKGSSLSCRIQDLRPGQEYSVCLQVHYQELQGSASEPTVFTTPPCPPDTPFAPKLITRTKNSLQVRWNATADNGSHILHYILEYDEGKGKEFVEVCKTKGRQYSLTKLQPSTWYSFRLAAVNDCGKSPYSDIITFCTAANPPPQPTPPTLAAATSSSLRLEWIRRSQEEEYVLQMADKESGHGYLPMYTGRETVYECVNLRRATVFHFRLKAENEVGSSPWSDEVIYRTLPERPGRPGKPQVKGKIHATNFKAKWDPPSDRGGSEIKMYYLEINAGAGFERVYMGSETEAICDRLSPGTTYQIRVWCEGVAGPSAPSEPCTVTTEAVAPVAPSAPFCSTPPGPYATVLRWERPDYNGGAPVTEYEVEMEGGVPRQRIAVYRGKDTQCVAKDLSPGEVYVAQVRAINRIGAGQWSEEGTFVAGAAPPGIPGRPDVTIRSATHLTVSWEEPATNGAFISEYRLESAVNNQEDCYNIAYQGVQTMAEVRNLMPFTTYFFRVSATNAAGTSGFSAPISTRTPAAAPNAPIIESCDITSTEVTVYWRAPDCHGSPIRHYNIDCADRVMATTDAVTEYCIGDLQPETLYKIKIQAVNEIGAGPLSSALRVTTLPLPPKPPRLECTAAGHNFVKLKWGDGRNVDFTRYHVEMMNNRNREFVTVYTGTNYTCRVPKLQEQATYVFRICAETDHAGIGDYSDEVAFETTAAVPSSIKSPRIYEPAAGSVPVNDSSNCDHIHVEWQHSKNTFPDPVEYILQCTRSREQDYKQIYRGPETRFTVENLECGVEYCLRVCPVRLMVTGECLPGSFSPVLRHTVPLKSKSVIDSNAIAGAHGLSGGAPGASGGVTSQAFDDNLSNAGAVQRILGRVTTIYSSRRNFTDQQKAIIIAIFLMIGSVVLAYVVKLFNFS
ncbi:fibronectin type-III domain-containing protein 3A isoform X2 [Phlebotomus papatasi]|uniref:fibronectin type-III domain-containing protein 3A isoform X2 n=1 Tax=Phlebotomus papatasi TaxID=29031 RepID=UPI0024833898|nr:fibronectin type-III domain-containing protein 3A isoform X2 [Phlebotomus papatasi]XP_055713652.1 fibronectin type-III domain-containing protein 3A isoform X2 [Phlebotomus papatasi]XP_055713653.1 fibronectin type-III domain-containing protein 3A isoform X2 [Phlebotomus papatasi]XP_055713654.1 fibronectin type-III domain-containing protein 3A isoform X2 [Phlebotomus papatasi]